ncbi:hypothetical protein C4D60_Mb08t06290 [Musa balbisiana]|uniref:OTU domain-containing protein n=1 Tax=Musa balbisiana TaxID=52838 RepID=A0A4S8K1T7_MUSBA|nr:hypothetical protein C4D60_Mb08t06290 [Musa balbisiana]
MSGQPDYVRESSSSSRSSNIQETEDDMTIGSILAEANHHNGRNLGKRLSHLDSIPILGRPLPLRNWSKIWLERLAMYGLAELQVEGDGNCQFRAVADQLFHNPEYHRHVRKAVVKQYVLVR